MLRLKNRLANLTMTRILLHVHRSIRKIDQVYINEPLWSNPTGHVSMMKMVGRNTKHLTLKDVQSMKNEYVDQDKSADNLPSDTRSTSTSSNLQRDDSSASSQGESKRLSDLSQSRRLPAGISMGMSGKTYLAKPYVS